MKNKPLVSVIIPTYNEERYIDACLQSLLSQTYKPLEIIMVDDGSTDKTVEIAKRFKINLFKQKHMGPAGARNLGASKAKGEILVFPDADMKYDKKYIKILVKPILDKKAIGTFNKNEYVANTDNIWSNCWAINSDLPINKRHSENLPKYLSVFRAILKEDFDRVGGYDNLGYGDDSTISDKLGVQSYGVKGAKAFHFNPSSLIEVFYSARWIGRDNKIFKPDIFNFFRFSLFNSIRISFRKIYKKKVPLRFIIFKLVYDFGVLVGIFLNFGDSRK